MRAGLLTNDGAGESYGGDIVDSRRFSVSIAVFSGQDGVYGSNDIVHITIAEQTGTAGEDGQELSELGLGLIEWDFVISVIRLDGGSLARGRLLPEPKDHGDGGTPDCRYQRQQALGG